MALYCGMDLHGNNGNNTYVVVADERDKPLYDKRLPNRLDVILRALESSHTDTTSSAWLWNRPSTGTGWSMD